MQNLSCARDRHLYGAGPKRILALDGGGVRGVLTIAFLERLEMLLAEAAGAPVRLCDWFDLIGGTSTGAIIATLLALGLSAHELKAVYDRLAPHVFKRSRWRVPGWSAKFNSSALQKELDEVLGDKRLKSDDLQTGLGIVLKRLDTGGAWVVINNPKSKFWNTPEDKSFIGNGELRLAKLVRASTAAPHYFDPELIEIAEGEMPGLFLDGGLTPHNNPALVLFLAAALPPVGINWKLSPDQLSIVSVGTGSFRPTLSIAEAKKSHAIGLAVKALSAQIAENQRLTLTLMSWLGHTSMIWPIDSEIGDVGAIAPPFGALFRFNRLDVLLEHKWLKETLDIPVSAAELQWLRQMDNPASMPLLYDIGRQAAALQLKAEHVKIW